MEKRAYQVSWLISLSTLPERFYPLVHDLSGREIEYNNPGISLRSYLITKCIRHEIVLIEEPIQTIIRECEEFTASRKILLLITESLVKSATGVMLQMSNQSRGIQIAMVRDVTDLQELSQSVKATLDAFLSIQEEGDKVDLFSMPGIKLRQALYELQDKIGHITEALNRVPVLPERA